jgi:hypothetical protein
MKLKKAKLAKNLLYFSLSALSGCSVNYALEPNYPAVKIPQTIFNLKEESRLETTTKNGVYNYWRKEQDFPKYDSLFADSDKDGIENKYDPWPYAWGPVKNLYVGDFQNLKLSLKIQQEKYSPLLKKLDAYSYWRETENKKSFQ